MRKIDPKTLNQNVFSAIGEQWMLITAGTADRCNTMTASWGGLGVIWGAPAATCYIRPQRYTKEFVDQEEYFTLSFLGEESRKALQLCGSKSGRDTDKIKECGNTQTAAPPTSRRPSWCWYAANGSSSLWPRRTSPRRSKTGGIRRRTTTPCILEKLLKF